jgi:hypothetical protein
MFWWSCGCGPCEAEAKYRKLLIDTMIKSRLFFLDNRKMLTLDSLLEKGEIERGERDDYDAHCAECEGGEEWLRSEATSPPLRSISRK